MRHFILITLALFSSVASADVGDRGTALEPVQVAAATVTVAPAAPVIDDDATDADAPTDVTLAATSLHSTASVAFMTLASAATKASTSVSMMAMNAPISDVVDGDEGAEEVQAPVVLAKVPSAQELRLQYQRIGRDLLKLEEQRGKFDCGGMIPRFKAIKLDAALASTPARAQLAVELAAMATKIDRLRGIKLDTACLQNPLAAGCM